MPIQAPLRSDQLEPVLVNKTLVNPALADFVELMNAPAAGASFTIDTLLGMVHKLVTNANTTITLPASVAGKEYTLLVEYGGTHTITWAGGGTLKWPSSTAPTVTSVAGKVDMFVFTCDGTNTFGRMVGSNF